VVKGAPVSTTDLAVVEVAVPVISSGVGLALLGRWCRVPGGVRGARRESLTGR
jgi:hypothetical protein